MTDTERQVRELLAQEELAFSIPRANLGTIIDTVDTIHGIMRRALVDKVTVDKVGEIANFVAYDLFAYSQGEGIAATYETDRYDVRVHVRSKGAIIEIT